MASDRNQPVSIAPTCGILVAAFLLFVITPGFFLGYFRATRDYYVTALLQVEGPGDKPQRAAQIRGKYLSLITSPEVVAAALATPGINQLGTLSAVRDPRQFVTHRLNALALEDGRTFEVSLHGYTRSEGRYSTDDDIKILNALINRFEAALAAPPADQEIPIDDSFSARVIKPPAIGHSAITVD